MEETPSCYETEISNRQTCLPVDSQLLCKAVTEVLRGEGVVSGHVSLAIVNNSMIHSLNVQYLEHDYPTDVLSFLLDDSQSHWEGEIIVSAEMAVQQAARYGWAAEDELLLYVVHGLLHLVGCDDQDDLSRQRMREQEDRYLAVLGCRRGVENDSKMTQPQQE